MKANQFGPSLAELIGDSPAGQVQQPRFEGADCRVVLKLRDAPGHGNDGFLDGFLGLLIGEAGLAGDTIDQLPISMEEILPTFLVFPILEPAQQAVAGGNQFFSIEHSIRSHTGFNGSKCHFFQKSSIELIYQCLAYYEDHRSKLDPLIAAQTAHLDE